MHYRLLPLLLILLPLGCISLPEDVTLRDEARLLWDMGRDAEAFGPETRSVKSPRTRIAIAGAKLRSTANPRFET